MKISSTRTLVLTLTLAVFSSFALGAKKVVFLADGGKNNEKHNHVDGNDILAAALEDSKLGFETAQYKGWPTDPKAFDGADSVVMFCNGGKKHHLVMKHLDQFEKLIDAGTGFVFMHYGVEVPKGRAGDLMLRAMGGYFEEHWSVNPHWKADFKSLPKHPITRGVKPFVQDDEWYYHMLPTKHEGRNTDSLSTSSPVHYEPPGRTTLQQPACTQIHGSRRNPTYWMGL